MKCFSRMILSLAALLAFAAAPVVAQHGGGKAGGMGDGMSKASDNHGNSAKDSQSGKSSTSESKVSDQLTDNSKLSQKLQDLLPPGTNLQQAAQGFKNLGQFVAAVHVSNNLGIPFDQLRSKMIGPPSESLGKAIHALKPDANSKTAASTAKKQAKQDINDTKSS